MGRWLSFRGLWSRCLKPKFGEEPPTPSPEALAYHAIFNAVKTLGPRRAVYRESKPRFLEEVKRHIDTVYSSWICMGDRVHFTSEEGLSLALRVVDEVWGEVFPEGGEQRVIGGGGTSRRRLFEVRPDLAERLTQTAGERGVKARTMLNEAVELAVAAAQFGVKPRRLLELYGSMSTLQKLGMAPMPMSLVDGLLTKLTPQNREDAMAVSREAGLALGMYLKSPFQGEEGAFRSLKEIFKSTGMMNISDLELSKSGNQLQVTCKVGPSLHEAKLTASFLEGTLHTFGYRTVRSDCTESFIALTLRWRSE